MKNTSNVSMLSPLHVYVILVRSGMVAITMLLHVAIGAKCNVGDSWFY